MRTNDNKFLKKDEDRLSRKGENIYYLGTLFFVAGIVLLAFSSASIMFFQVSSVSEARLVIETVTYMGCGLLSVTLGINLMLRQSKKGYLIFSSGFIFAVIGIVLFFLNFETNWFYPMISYILLFYLFGFLLLMGNAFGHVTLWILRKNQDTYNVSSKKAKEQHEYTDEEIQRDIDQAIKQSLQHAADDLQFDIASSSPKFKVSAGMNSETVVRRRDSGNEAMVLQQTLNPGSTEQWGGAGIDKAASMLADTLNSDSSYKKKFFHFFKRK